MRFKRWSLIRSLILLACVFVSHPPTPTKAQQVRVLRNADILQMVEDRVKPGVIVARIMSSHCNFDIFPPVLRDLKRRGVPDNVILAMQSVPVGPPALAEVDAKGVTKPSTVRIPEGTAIEVETAKAVSSANSPPGTSISFLVTKRIFLNNVLVIERGALARAHVVKSKKAAALGRAGMLAWEMDYVVAVDGTRIPIQLVGKQSGANRSAAMAGGAVATGALIFPYSSPVALIWGLKKGDEAVIRGSRVYSAIVKTGTDIAGLQPRPGGAIYHDQETVKASAAPPTNTNFDRGGFKPKGSFRPNSNK